jgi:hypothetical protein
MKPLPHLAAALSTAACLAHAGLSTDPPPGVDEPAFYERLRAMLAELGQSKDPLIKRLHDAALASPAKIHIRPITADKSTWNSDGTQTRGHTDPDDKAPKAEGRAKPADATVYVPPDAVEPGKLHWKSGTLVHELTHAIDLANGRYSPTVTVRERRASFVQNAWRSHTGAALRTSYHGRFPTLDYQEALKHGAIDEYARYIFTRSDFPEPPKDVAPATKSGGDD